MLKKAVHGKTLRLIVAAVLFSMLLALVGAAGPTMAQEGTTLDTSYENAVSVEMQLILGTFKLMGTGQAITAEQAAILLPLWTDIQTLTQSAAPADPGAAAPQSQAQIDALIVQVQAAMTADQIQAIDAMQITQESAMTIMQELGLTRGGGQQPPGGGAGGQPPSGDASGQQPPSGGAGGQPPSGGAGDQQPGGQQPPSGGAGGPGGNMMQPELMSALIQVLERISANEAVTFPLEMASGDPEQAAPDGTSPGGAVPGGSSDSSSATITAAYTLDGGTETLTGQTITASNTDESAVYVLNGGSLTLANSTITTSGETSSQDQSSFYGLNAAVLAGAGSSITMSDSTISTTGSGANGAFATGEGSSVTLTNVTINATGGGGHGVMATLGGTLTLNNVNMDTTGANSGAIATDRGSGTITATGGMVTTSGQDSPGIYSTGAITVSGATISASGAEAAVIEGANSITLNNVALSSTLEGKWGVMIYQSMSGDAEGTQGVFTMTGGSLAYTSTSGPLFFVTNSTGIITLKGVSLTAGSGLLVQAGATDRWGNAGSNGGTVILTADGQTLAGDMAADAISTITAALQNGSSLTGAINADDTAQAVTLTLDAGSTWNVTADSHLTCLDDSGGISGTTITNITGSGHTVTYDPAVCPALAGQTYSLNGGGTLQPAA